MKVKLTHISVLVLSIFLFMAGTSVQAHEGHDHSGHSHSAPAKAKKANSHAGHNHAGHSHAGHNHAAPGKAKGGDHSHGHGGDHHDGEHEEELNIGDMIIHHITDANEFHVAGDFSVPLPCIVYHPEQGFDFFLSNKFHHGHDSYKGYVLNHGRLMYVDDASFPKDKSVPVSFTHGEEVKAKYNGKEYPISRSGFYDFSITKVVFTMLMATLAMFLIFVPVARGYGKRMVPKGIQSFFEPLILFVRDDIAIPNLGSRYKKYMPFLLTLFFFIWICNILGLIPFFPGSGNVTGNIAVTLTLAVFTFIVTNMASNKHFWGHIFNPPGVPLLLKPIMIVIEVLSIFTKPFALMIRLFANITGGHIIILSLTGIIFLIYSLSSAAMGEGTGTVLGFMTSVISGAFMLFMNALELFVAALQAYVFTVLSAVFIGQASEEPAHH